MTFTVVTAIAAIQANHKGEILFLQEMIKKPLLFKESFSTTLLFDPDATFIKYPGIDTLPKTIIER